MKLRIETHKKRQVIDITELIQKDIPAGASLVNVFVKHTTAAITTADLDPGTDEDLLDALQNMIPEQKWRHPHNPEHAPDHLISSIIGPSVLVPINNDRLSLGTWQRVVLIELDGPREREVELTFLQSK